MASPGHCVVKFCNNQSWGVYNGTVLASPLCCVHLQSLGIKHLSPNAIIWGYVLPTLASSHALNLTEDQLVSLSAVPILAGLVRLASDTLRGDSPHGDSLHVDSLVQHRMEGCSHTLAVLLISSLAQTAAIRTGFLITGCEVQPGPPAYRRFPCFQNQNHRQ